MGAARNAAAAEPAAPQIRDYMSLAGQHTSQQLRSHSFQMELITQAQKGNSTAEELLLHSNQGLVMSVARNYVGYGVPIEDLLQEGNLGLLVAVRRFNVASGHRFSTYAVWWIRQAIARAVAQQARPIRLPEYVQNRLRKLHQDNPEWSEGELLTEENIDLPVDVSEIPSVVASVDQPLSNSETQTVGDLIACDDEGACPERAAAHWHLRELLREAIGVLKDKEQFAIERHFGLHDGTSWTFSQLARELGMTREGLRKLVQRALKKLHKHALETGSLEGYEQQVT